MTTVNYTGIEKLSKCYRDVSKVLISRLLRPENKKRFGRKSEHPWKIILPWDVKFQVCQISADIKNVKGRSLKMQKLAKPFRASVL